MLNQRDYNKPFFLVVAEKVTHRSWLPNIPDLGNYDAEKFPKPLNCNDNYVERIAAKNQDMLVRKTLTNQEDLKVRPDYNSRTQYSLFTPE